MSAVPWLADFPVARRFVVPGREGRIQIQEGREGSRYLEMSFVLLTVSHPSYCSGSLSCQGLHVSPAEVGVLDRSRLVSCCWNLWLAQLEAVLHDCWHRAALSARGCSFILGPLCMTLLVLKGWRREEVPPTPTLGRPLSLARGVQMGPGCKMCGRGELSGISEVVSFYTGANPNASECFCDN